MAVKQLQPQSQYEQHIKQKDKLEFSYHRGPKVKSRMLSCILPYFRRWQIWADRPKDAYHGDSWSYRELNAANLDDERYEQLR